MTMNEAICQFALKHNILTDRVALMLLEELTLAEENHYLSLKNAERVFVTTGNRELEYIFWQSE